MTFSAAELSAGLAAALGLVVFFYLPVIRIGLYTHDEGYLLSGTLDLAEGRVAVRDFRGYDPARYYWCLPFIYLFKPGILRTRLAMAVLMVPALMTVWYLAMQASADLYFSLALQVAAFSTFYRSYKMPEIFFSLLYILAAYQLISGHSALLFAFLISFSTFAGLNFLVYSAGTLVLTVVVMLLQGTPSQAVMSAFLSLPVALAFSIGLLPFLWLVLFKEDYLATYIRRKVMPILKRGSTNLKRPLPFLFRPGVSIDQGSRGRDLVLKLVFTVYPVMTAGCLFFTVSAGQTNRHSDLLTAAALAAFSQIHYVFSRAGFVHLLTALQPFILMIGGLTLYFAPTPAWYILALAAGLYPVMKHPIIKRLRPGLQPVVVNHERLLLTANEAFIYTELKEVIEAHSSDGEPVFFAPVMPGFYPMFNRRPVIYDTYPVYPAGEQEQLEMIAAFEKAGLGLAVIKAPSKNDDGFLSTHPFVWQYFNRSYKKVGPEKLGRQFTVFSR